MHVPCFYRVIQTRVKVWENEKCCGNTSRRRVFPQLFRVLPNFHSCFYNSIGTRRTCFLFLLENTATKKKKNNLFPSIIKMQILFVRAIITSTACASSVFLSSYRNTVLNQSAWVFALDYFLNIVTIPDHAAAQNLHRPRIRTIIGKQTISYMATNLWKRTSNPFQRTLRIWFFKITNKTLLYKQ